jgi:dipeptidyl-peptidase III
MSVSVKDSKQESHADKDFPWIADKFADITVLRYKVPHWDQLPLKTKLLAYYLVEAGRCGFDIIYDQNYKHNVKIRRALIQIWKCSAIERSNDQWCKLEQYIKQFSFANGIHHHYSNDKFIPEFSESYFRECLQKAKVTLAEEIIRVIFSAELDIKKVEQDEQLDVVARSAVNFYETGITREEVAAFYDAKSDKKDLTPISYGLNSRLVKNKDGTIEEQIYCTGGLYGKALRHVVGNLELAMNYAPPNMQEGLKLLIEYFRTGDLQIWDEYCIHWVEKEKGNMVDYILGFIEVYSDPLGRKGTFESVVQIVDLDATEKMRVLQNNAQYFEDNSPTLKAHKRENVVGITFNFINVASNGGDNSPASAIGVNLPNANWIRTKHGSKSVNLGNISNAYENASGSHLRDEFYYTQEEKDRASAWGELADTLHTALHEVIGHGSGKLESNVQEHALELYHSTIEEGRADLVALYYLMDPKLLEFNLMPNMDVGKTSYDDYISNGLLRQLRRLKPGAKIEEAHMRNRHWISSWVFEKGQKDNVICKITDNDKTYFRINDYEKLRLLFGELLKEVQRIKSQGDISAAKALVESYGVNVDPMLHKEVLDRCAKLGDSPYKGFIQATYSLVHDMHHQVIDVVLDPPTQSFMDQIVYFNDNYSFL